MTARTKWLFYLLLTSPFFYLIYLAITDDLGAQPAEAINKKLGNITLIMLLANLYWGSIDAFFKISLLGRYVSLRRPLGVAAFIYALLHLCSYFLREGDFKVAFEQMTEKIFLLFGLAAFFILLALAITSNNWSLRKLRAKRWKQLHRFVYLAFFLITAHVLLIEKKSWLSNKYTLFPMLAVFVVRICYSFRPRKIL